MARTGIRLAIVGLGLGAVLVSAFTCGVGAEMMGGPQQRVGIHLEFGAEPGATNRAADDDLISGTRDSLPRLLESTGARHVKVQPVDPSTLEVTFDPPQPWSAVHGLRADGAEDAPLLLPDALLTLLTTPCDVRLLEVESTRSANPVDRDRTERQPDHHPERALDVLHTALHEAPVGGSAVAWLPRADGKGDLVPLRVEGDHDRRITALELSNAKRTSASIDMEFFLNASSGIAHASYLAGLAGRRVAIVVDGKITWLGEARADERKQLVFVGEADSTTIEACASIVAQIHRPLLPQKPRITRSWIEPNHAAGGGVFLLAVGIVSGLFALGMLWAFVREMRRPPARTREVDWSSAA